MNRFDAPWGRSVKLVTLLGSLVLFVIPLAALIASDFSGALSLVVVLPLLIRASTLPFMERGYQVSAGQLQIIRLGWTTVFPLRALRSAEHRPKVMARSWRLFGNGGLFAVHGWFRNRKLGNYRAFLNNMDDTVVLRFDDRTVVVAPGDPERFLQALSSYVGHGERP